MTAFGMRPAVTETARRPALFGNLHPLINHFPEFSKNVTE